jgi:AcrR family transcriptional regulator
MARPRNFEEDDVVDTAMWVFLSKGYRDATPRVLTEATGLSKSSLYSTFGNKEGLFLRVLARYLDHQDARMREAFAKGSLRSNLQQMYAMALQMVAGDEPMTCLVCSTSIEGDGSAEVAAAVAQGRERMVALFQERLERAQADGELEASRDPAALADLMMALNMGFAVLARSGADRASLRGTAELAVDFVCG